MSKLSEYFIFENVPDKSSLTLRFRIKWWAKPIFVFKTFRDNYSAKWYTWPIVVLVLIKVSVKWILGR